MPTTARRSTKITKCYMHATHIQDTDVNSRDRCAHTNIINKQGWEDHFVTSKIKTKLGQNKAIQFRSAIKSRRGTCSKSGTSFWYQKLAPNTAAYVWCKFLVPEKKPAQESIAHVQAIYASFQYQILRHVSPI